MLRSLAILSLLSAAIRQQNCEPVVKLTNVVCESYNKSWITIEHCRLKAIRRDLTVMNINATILQPAKKIHVIFDMQKKANGYKPWLINYTFDVCANLRRPSHFVAKLIFKLLKDTSNIDHPCPYQGKMWLKNFQLNANNLELPLPTGEYAMFITWIFGNKRQLSTNIFLQYIEDIVKQ